MTNSKRILQQVRTAANKDELMSAYREWASEYDQDLVGEMGYVAPTIASRLLETYLESKNSKILDVGCGTGLVGECLRQRGFKNLEGLDYSEDMLREADKKKVYLNLRQGDLTESVDIRDCAFDAVICVGTFTCSHLGPEALTELVRIVKPSGYVCFTVRDRAWEEEDYRAKILDLESSGAFEVHEMLTSDYLPREGVKCKLCLCEIKG